MAIKDDFTIYPYSKVIRHTSGTTVYTVTQFYSWLMDTFDEPGYMSYEAPMAFATPTQFTMINGWFLDNGDGSQLLDYLTGASILTSGYATVADPVYMLDADDDASVWADIVAGDKDKDLLDDGVAVGPILSYKLDYSGNSTARIWVRDTRTSPAAIADNSALTVTGGTFVGDAAGASVNGDETYANLYTIASFPGSPDPQVYVYQDHPATGARTRLSETSGLTNWDRGSIDVLIPVRLGGSLVNSGLVDVFVRQTGDLFTYVQADLSAGSRTPVATETSADSVNVTKGEWYLLVDGATDFDVDFSVGDVISDVASGKPTWYAEVVAVTEGAAATHGVLTLRGLRGTIADNDAIYVSGVQEGTANGVPGDTLVTYVSEGGTPPTAADTLMEGGTSGARRLLKGVQDNGTSGTLVLAVDHTVTGSAKDVYHVDFSASEQVQQQGTPANYYTNTSAASTTIISGYSNITIAHINGSVTTSSSTGTWEVGEVVTWNTGSSSAIFAGWITEGTNMMLANITPGDEPDAADAFTGASSGATANCDSTVTYDNTMPYAFTQQSTADYSVLIEGGTVYSSAMPIADIYAYLQYFIRDGATGNIYHSANSTPAAPVLLAAEEYIAAITTGTPYAVNKSAPFGNKAGTLFQGAQGVWLQGQSETVTSSTVSLTDHTGTVQTPFDAVAVTVTNTRADDVILVALEDGNTGLPDKTQYTSANTGNAVDTVGFDKDAVDFPIDTPASGSFFVVDNTNNEEHRYRYTSWSGTTLTMPAEVTDTLTGATTATQIVATGATWQTDGIQKGDIMHRDSDNAWAYVIDVVNETTINTTILSDGSAWASADVVRFHSLVATYSNTDTFYIPYIDSVETTGSDASPGSETVSILYAANRPVVYRARNVENASYRIVPFAGTSDITTAGMTAAIVRTDDTVYA